MQIIKNKMIIYIKKYKYINDINKLRQYILIYLI